MLSRVADALFWMSRYLERAETVARLLDVRFHLELDLRGVLPGSPEREGQALLAILQVPPRAPEVNGTGAAAALHHWLTFESDNPNSIMSCVNKARSNARGIRGSISSEVWRELNKLYWQLRDPEFAARAGESPHEFYRAVEVGSHLVQGTCDATLVHDEGWQFIQLGKFLERADKTLRILDVKYQQLQELTAPADLPLANLQWAGVLKYCLAYEAYQRLFISRVEPERVVEFLLMHPHFPRSVRFCLESAAHALAEIEGPGQGRSDGKADRILGRVLSELRFGEIEQLLADDLHGFLDAAIRKCLEASASIQEQYAFS